MDQLPYDVLGVVFDYLGDGLDSAALSGVNRGLAELIRERRRVGLMRTNFWDFKTVSQIIWELDHGLEVKKCFRELAHKNKFDMVIGLLQRGFKCIERIVCIAANTGNLESVKGILLNGGPMCNAAPGWAAEAGHLHIIQWLEANGFIRVKYDTDVMAARREGHQDTVLWLLAHGWPEN